MHFSSHVTKRFKKVPSLRKRKNFPFNPIFESFFLCLEKILSLTRQTEKFIHHPKPKVFKSDIIIIIITIISLSITNGFDSAESFLRS
jgi:hypothetical protein